MTEEKSIKDIYDVIGLFDEISLLFKIGGLDRFDPSYHSKFKEKIDSSLYVLRGISRKIEILNSLHEESKIRQEKYKEFLDKLGYAK